MSTHFEHCRGFLRELLNTVEVCSLSQITGCLTCVGQVPPHGMSHLKQNPAVALRKGGSLGQITACLTGVVGKFRPMV